MVNLLINRLECIVNLQIDYGILGEWPDVEIIPRYRKWVDGVVLLRDHSCLLLSHSYRVPSPCPCPFDICVFGR